MQRALQILAALFATAAIVLAICIVIGTFQYIVPNFPKLRADPKNAALLGIALGYLVAFVLVYAQAARLIWRRQRWSMAVTFSCLACFGIPVGPVLGVISIILLTRPSVRATFHG